MDVLIRGKVSESRRVVLPARLCKELGIEDGADVLFSRSGDSIKITIVDKAIRHAQEKVRQFIPEGAKCSSDVTDVRRHAS